MTTMRFETETRDLKKLSRDLLAAPPKVRTAANKILKTQVTRAAVEARAAAPKDRPWLGTEQGLQVVSKWPLTWSIHSPYDPEGKSVGYRVVYGTSTRPPNDFVTPPLVRAGDRFNREALVMLGTVIL